MRKKAKVRRRTSSKARGKRRAEGAAAAHPTLSQSLSLLSEISQELTSILERDELFSRIAQHVKRVVDYHLFSVMLWNEESTQLESVFAVHYGGADPGPRPRPTLQRHHRLRCRRTQAISR